MTVRSLKEFYDLLESCDACGDGLADIESCETLDDVLKLPDIIEYIEWGMNGNVQNSLSQKVIDKFQQVIIDTGDPHLCYSFAYFIEMANIEKLQQVVIESKDTNQAVYFAKDIEGADIEKLQQMVIESKATRECYYFARDVEGANVVKLQQVIVDEKDRYWHDNFMMDVEDANPNLWVES